MDCRKPQQTHFLNTYLLTTCTTKAIFTPFFRWTFLAIFPKDEGSVYAFVEISTIKIRHNAITW